MFDLNHWQQRVARQTFIQTALIDGQPVGSIDGATFDAINPATQQLLHVSRRVARRKST